MKDIPDLQFNNLVGSVKNLQQDMKVMQSAVVDLAKQMKEGFAYMKNRFVEIDRRFDMIDKRFDGVDKKFDGVDRHFAEVERAFDKKLDGLETTMLYQFNKVYDKIDKVDAKYYEVSERQDDHEKEERDHRAEILADFNKIKSTSGYLDTAVDKHNIRITHLELKAGISADPPAYATAEA